MSVLKFVCAAAFGAVAWGAAAQAADIYGGNGGNGGYGGYKDDPAFVPAPSWRGYYIGGNAGWAWSSIDAANNAVILSNNGTVPFRSPGTRDLFGGMQMGYNAQSGNFLYGIEADLGGLDDGASGSFTDPKNASASGRLEDTVTANTVKVGFNYLVHGQRLPLN